MWPAHNTRHFGKVFDKTFWSTKLKFAFMLQVKTPEGLNNCSYKSQCQNSSLLSTDAEQLDIFFKLIDTTVYIFLYINSCWCPWCELPYSTIRTRCTQMAVRCPRKLQLWFKTVMHDNTVKKIKATLQLNLQN